ncbi:MarR family winged helix-turn-helix transcriptional regulator [Dyella sp. C9]|uniref:MarR family winged helix-turn-helix transcriptional regulator n=1 Tax=Dyella sp. C9 TaxID=2202154 RepID=UPI000DEFB640|nr:MarR family transcriptional regulator [Dyella sp. C9]
MSRSVDWSLFDNPAPLINMASRSFARLGDRQVKPLGFAIGQMPVVYLLRDGGSMSQKQLATLAKIEQPSMAQMLSRMERDGLIQRSPDPADGRSSLISLTRGAMAKIPKVREVMNAGNRQAFDDFSKAEITMLVDLLRRLNSNLDRLLAEENPGEPRS